MNTNPLESGNHLSMSMTQGAIQFSLICHEMWLFLVSSRDWPAWCISKDTGCAGWGKMSLLSVRALWCPNNPRFVSCFLACAWSYPQAGSLGREDVRNCSSNPPVRPWPYPHRPLPPIIFSIPPPQWPVAGLSYRLSSEFCTLGPLFLTKVHQQRLRYLTYPMRVFHSSDPLISTAFRLLPWPGAGELPWGGRERGWMVRETSSWLLTEARQRQGRKWKE